MKHTMKPDSGSEHFYKTLVRLALPISLQNLITFAVNFADNLMVGSLGDLAISGVFIGNQIHALLQFIVGGIGAALVILATQYWGKKDTKSIRSIITICLWAGIFAGVVFTVFSVCFPSLVIGVLTIRSDVFASALPYVRIVGISFVFFAVSQVLIASLRSVEKVRFGMFVALAALCVNVSLNYCLVFGKFGFPALGVTGAAIATLISRIVEFIIVLIYVFAIDKRIGMAFKDLVRFEKQLVSSLIKYGSPVVAGDVVWAVNSFAYTAIVGRFTADTIAAFNIAGMMNTLVYVWISGMAGAVGIMTGKMVGAGEIGGLKPYAYRVQKFFLCVGAITGLFVFLTKGALISFYNISPEAVIGSKQLITVLSFTIMGTAYQMTSLFGLVKSGGNISFVFKNDTIFVFVVVIPSAIIAVVFNAPAWAVFLCLKCDQILKCFVAVVVVNRFKWVRNLTVV
ncbi:MATE family efflux transporter [Treponema primitia]|uniref:MATE family efflux transporter n=1 Tax=Treponema primitia TaxID=88058 RepID=UPI0009DB51FC|nr:MATE family efflux transporter [Treponema primitia]